MKNWKELCLAAFVIFVIVGAICINTNADRRRRQYPKLELTKVATVQRTTIYTTSFRGHDYFWIIGPNKGGLEHNPDCPCSR